MPPVPIRWGLIIDPQRSFKPHALLSTDLTVPAQQIVAGCVLRWQLEVTFEEARAHLGIAPQRPWSDLAILRTTPALLGLFALVTLFAQQVLEGEEVAARTAAWYSKPAPTFADTLAFVRQRLWPVNISWISHNTLEVVTIPKALVERLTDTLANASVIWIKSS